jgi:FKBP-type peptidyl-prolyl cis-trans isomerase FklB
MQKPTFSYGSTFIRALALTILLAGATLTLACAQQASTSGAQQAPASSATQDSSAASTPAKPDAKATPGKKPSTKTAQTKPAATTDSQANAPAKASTTSGAAASTKQASAAPAGQAGATKTGPAATKTTKPGAGKTATAKTAAALTLNTPKDKQSYAIGINVGKGLSQNLKQSGVDIDPAILSRAIKDVLSGGKQSMTDQEAQATLTALQAEMRKAQDEKTKQLSEGNKKEGDEFLAANKIKEGVTTLPDGLQYKILQEGTGPKPTATDAVTVNYRGALVNGTEFDSSYKRGQPATFNVTGIIKGWTEALELMPVGSKWQLVIPSDLAYGPSGRPPVIGPNSTLVFEVELVSIQPKPVAPAPAAAPATAPAPAAASPNAAPAPNAPAPPKPTPPSPKPDQAPAPTPTPKPPTP